MKTYFYNIVVFFVFVSAFHSFAQEKISFANNKVIAHRGAWKKNKLPHNSIAALKQAINLGCAGTEFDVRMTKDSILVVYHDATFNDLLIEESEYHKLLKYQLSNGENLPTLKDYLEAGLKDNFSTGFVCEIKPSETKAKNILLAEEVVSLVEELKAENFILSYISFNYEVLKTIKKISPSSPTQFLGGTKSPKEIKKDGITGLDYHFDAYKNNPEWVSAAKKMGLTLNAWTANNAQDIEWLLANKFDYITTDEPELLTKPLWIGNP